MTPSAAVIPSDSPSIYASLTSLQNQALVMPNNPPAGISGFLFDIPRDSSLVLDSEITDNWVENNTALQDQIALHPEEFTLEAAQGELIDHAVYPQPASVTTPEDPLPINEPLTPTLTPGAAQTQSQQQTPDINSQAAISGTASTLYSFYQSKAAQNSTRQALAVNYLYQLWLGRELVTVQTPWGIFTNMAIKRVQAKQGKDSRFVTEVMVTFKKIRVTGSQAIINAQLSGRAANQTLEANPSQFGDVVQTPVSSQTFAQYVNQWSGGLTP